MLDAKDLIESIKMVAKNSTDASKPTAIVFGKVEGINPLKISVENKLKLSTNQLILPDRLSDKKFKVTIDDGLGTIGTVDVNNALKVGEEVILLRVQGGQKYLIMDKVQK